MDIETISLVNIATTVNGIYAIGNNLQYSESDGGFILYYNTTLSSTPSVFGRQVMTHLDFSNVVGINTFTCTKDGFIYFCTSSSALYYSVDNGATINKITSNVPPLSTLVLMSVSTGTDIINNITYDILFLYGYSSLTILAINRTSFTIVSTYQNSIYFINSISCTKNIAVLNFGTPTFSFTYGYCIYNGDIYIGSSITMPSSTLTPSFVAQGLQDYFTSLSLESFVYSALVYNTLGTNSIVYYKLSGSVSWTQNGTIASDLYYLSIDNANKYIYICKNLNIFGKPANTFGYINVTSGAYTDLSNNLPNISATPIGLTNSNNNLLYISLQSNGLYYSYSNGAFQQSQSCFYKGTLINTPEGFKKIEFLKNNDSILLYNDQIVSIKSINKFYNKHSNNRLFVLKKNCLEKNIPFDDLYLSEGHAFKYNGKYHHMHHTQLANVVDNCNEVLEYYHIELDNWFEYTINANGVECESYLKVDKDYNIKWSCDSEECKYTII